MAKLCECGCGEPAPIATRNDARKGWVKGKAKRFRPYHHLRLRPTPTWTIEDRGHKTPCWVWQGATGGHGQYPRGKRDGRNGAIHRWNYEEKYGRIPEGHQAHHVCAVKACVNPDHIRIVTPAEHRVLEGRLSPAQVEELQQEMDRLLHGRLRRPNGSVKALAERFGISKQSVRYHIEGSA